MECGVPFCHDGCPLGNLIPDWNDLVYKGRWREAIDQLHATNNFPEFTGLICPAPCEPACVLAINDDPVSIKQIELAIVERAWEEGWIVAASRPSTAAGAASAVVGSGPAGPGRRRSSSTAPATTSSCYERDEGPGGLLRFGVPDFKLEKWYIDRRVAHARGARACGSSTASTSAPTSPRTSSPPATTRSCSRSARACTARSTCRAPTSPACASRWTTSTRATAGSRAATTRATTPSSPPPASTSS